METQNITQAEIDAAGITRLQFSDLLGIAYQTLGARMNRFAAWPAGELDRARAILEKVKAEKPGAIHQM